MAASPNPSRRNLEPSVTLPREANVGSPLKGDFERMARRRFQDPKPVKRGDWWVIQVRLDDFKGGSLHRKKTRVRIAPASMGEREVRKVVHEYLRPLNQNLNVIGSATNFNHYVNTVYRPT